MEDLRSHKRQNRKEDAYLEITVNDSNGELSSSYLNSNKHLPSLIYSLEKGMDLSARTNGAYTNTG